MTNRERCTARRQKLLDQGLCVRCGRNQPRSSKTTCAECAAKFVEISRRSKQKHAARIRIVRKKYNILNRSVLRVKSAKYYQDNIMERRQADAERARSLKIEVFTHYCGGSIKCALCPEIRLGALTIDHINGGGRAHRKALKRHGPSFYRLLKQQQYPKEYRVLCSNCNWMAYLASIRNALSMTKGAIKSRRYNANTKQRLMDLLGGQCVTCGCRNIDALSTHHTNNDGAAHRACVVDGLGGCHFYRVILQSGDLSGLECMCMSCNDCLQWE